MINSSEDHYATLAVDRDASPSIIKRAYLQLIQVHTPERDAEQFQRITEAYQTLSNPEKRKAYDAEERLPPQLHARIAKILEDAEDDHDEIADNLCELVDEWPSLRVLREMAGHHCMLADRPGDAAEVFRELCDLDPENARYMTRLGIALLKDGEDDEGVATLKAALAADPHSTAAYLNLSIHYMEEEKPEEAVRILNRGIDADGNLDAADLPLLIQLVIIHGRELAWDPLRSIGLKIRRLVGAEDMDARRYVVSQLAELIEPYSKVDRPDMLHFLFDLMADLDPTNDKAAEFRNKLTREGAAWREKVEFYKAQREPDWFGMFVHALLDEEDDGRRKELLEAVVIHVAGHRSEALARWANTKQRFPALASQLEDRWKKLLDVAATVAPRPSHSSAPTSATTNAGCLVFLASVALLATSLALALLL